MVVFNQEQIKEILPHRLPFLMVDEIIEFIPEKKSVGIKYVKEEDFFFDGHFPKHPIMPGVMIVEAMAQVGGIIIMKMEISNGKLAVLAGMEKVKFRSLVVPGNKLLITAETIKIRRKVGKIFAKAEVDEKIVAQAEIIYSLIDN